MFSLFLDLQRIVSNPLWDRWINTCADELVKIPRMPINIPLSYLLINDFSYQGVITTIDEILSLSDKDTRRFEWILVQGEHNKLSIGIERLRSLSYEVKLPQDTSFETQVFHKAIENVLLQQVDRQEPLPSHIDPIKLNRLFSSDPFTKSEQWHTRDLFTQEQERQRLLESQKPKRHDPLGIFESEEMPIVVGMTNPFVRSCSSTPLPNIKHDPLGIFQSNEKPVVIKMTNPFVRQNI